MAALAGALASEASGYEPARGDQFFLLSDASVGADGVAVVRLETPAGAPYGHVEGYGGADIVVYRVPDPIAFLKRQPNLHRVEVKGAYEGEGLANTLSHLWSQSNRQARIPRTSTNSTIVGMSWSTKSRVSSSMPLRPRSRTRVSPPVLRSR